MLACRGFSHGLKFEDTVDISIANANLDLERGELWFTKIILKPVKLHHITSITKAAYHINAFTFLEFKIKIRLCRKRWQYNGEGERLA
ncbi:hypothetical protein CEXT_475581 [Caerostris extrusa]|uniref:Uncharacterized protein n=1 Tax=Caerostris extrusa TaxID=172846 RepID=A0AAV4Y5F8_CAEEX|nr:hypothetical protein CEXT_475581 [Caerostris extrusa]